MWNNRRASPVTVSFSSFSCLTENRCIQIKFTCAILSFSRSFFFVSFFKFLKRKSKTCCIFSISAILSSSRIRVHKRMMEWIANVKWKTPSIAATSLNKCKIGICRSIEKCFVFQFPDYIHICLYLQRIYQHGSISSSIFFFSSCQFFFAMFFLLLLVARPNATTQERIRHNKKKNTHSNNDSKNIIEW